MTHGHAHEEAEHATHHAQDPFDRRVAMSMVVIAAVLATVKVIGHRTHNETLAYQIKAGVAQSQANVYHTQEAGQWNFFQSKKMREVLARQEAKLLAQQAMRGKSGAGKEASLPNRQKSRTSLVKELSDEKVPDAEKQAEQIVARAQKQYTALLDEGYALDQAVRIVDADMTADRYRAESRAIATGARKLHDKAEGYAGKSEGYLKDSEHKHHQANYFDLGELGVELALVLSSVAILTKRPSYWYGGLGLGVVGLIVVALGFLAH